MIRMIAAGTLALALSLAGPAQAVASAELYQNASYTYGRFEARLQLAAGDGVISSFFLWKPGSEVAGAFWNELDFEKLGAECRMQTNPLYGMPVEDHGQVANVPIDFCSGYHTYAFEWTPTYIAWLIDGAEVRREEGEVAAAFASNAASGMQIHFNLWPGDATFGGNFDPAILPVHQHMSWVQYSSLTDGAFVLEWREDFASDALPAGWATGNWASPKGYSTHAPGNVTFTSNIAVLSLTADDAVGFVGEPTPDDASVPDSTSGNGGTSGAGTGGPAETEDAGTSAVGSGAAGSVATTGGPTGGAGGAPPANYEPGGPPPLTDQPVRRPSDGGCSAGTGHADGTVGCGAFMLLGLAIASQRRRRS